MHRTGTFGLYKQETLRLDREILNLEFIRECKRKDIIPNWIRIKNKNVRKICGQATRELERRTMSNIIRTKEALINKLQHRCLNLYIEQYENLAQMVFDELMQKMHLFRMKQQEEKTFRQYNKMLRLETKQSANVSLTPKPVEYLNFSNRIFNDEEDEILKKGPKHILINKINPTNLIPIIEDIVNLIPETEHELFRSKAISSLKRVDNNYSYNCKKEISFIKEIKNDKSLIVIETDKSKRFAILNRDDYVDKMNETIDKMDCIKVDRNPLNRLIKKTLDIVHTGVWPEHIKQIIGRKPSEAIPRLFAKLKDHKANLPLRPIVAKNQGPTYFIEKAFVNILKTVLPPSPYVIVSAQNFCEKIKDFRIKTNSILVSMDIVQLYPSINIERATAAFEDLIQQQSEFNDDMKVTIMSGFNLIMNNNFFLFNGEIYLQKQGAPMGSPASGYIAELILRPLERIINENKDFEFQFWFRYVDDTFLVWNDDIDRLDDFLHFANGIDCNIQFTLEKETQGTLPFLDILITRNATRLNTSVYRKPNASTNTIKYGAKTPLQYQKSAYIFSIDRAISYCSDSVSLNSELDNIRMIANENGFPRRVIDNMIAKRKIKLNIRPPNLDNEKQIFKRIAIDYVPGFYESFKHICRKYQIDLVAKSSNRMAGSLGSEIDEIADCDRAGIYQIPYIRDNQEEGFYIGMTCRKLSKRIYEHKYDIRGGTEKSALSKLQANEDIIINFDGAKILYNFSNKNTALKKESITIFRRNSEICNKDLSWNIPNIWRAYLTQFDKRHGKNNKNKNRK